VLNGINVLTYVLVDRSGRTGICVRAIIRQKRHSLDTFALLNATCRVFPGPRTLFTIKEIITDVAVSHLARAGNYIFVQATEISAEPKFQPRTKSLYQIFFSFSFFFFFFFFFGESRSFQRKRNTASTNFLFVRLYCATLKYG